MGINLADVGVANVSIQIVPTEWFYKTNWVAPDYLQDAAENLKMKVLVQQTVRKQRRRLRGFW